MVESVYNLCSVRDNLGVNRVNRISGMATLILAPGFMPAAAYGTAAESEFPAGQTFRTFDVISRASSVPFDPTQADPGGLAGLQLTGFEFLA